MTTRPDGWSTCTPVVARWCPLHGTCTGSPDIGQACDDSACPLHGETSSHARRWYTARPPAPTLAGYVDTDALRVLHPPSAVTWSASSDRSTALHDAACALCGWRWPNARTKPATKAGMSPRRRAYYAARNHARRYGHETVVYSALRITVTAES